MMDKYLRATVYNKTDGHCGYCGRPFSTSDSWAVDHVHPQSRGGQSHQDNLILSCKSCNSRKSDKADYEFKLHIAQKARDDLQRVLDMISTYGLQDDDLNDKLGDLTEAIRTAQSLLYNNAIEFYKDRLTNWYKARMQ